MTEQRTLELLAWQHELTWSLAVLHLDALSEADLHWSPAPISWAVRQAPGGGWAPDWSEDDLEPIPVPTIAWITWHLGWWWSTALAHLNGRSPAQREDVTWPGELAGTRAWMDTLHADWVASVASLPSDRLNEEVTFPWPAGSGRTVADLLAWANAELMKNVAEIGQLRLLRAAGTDAASQGEP